MSQSDEAFLRIAYDAAALSPDKSNQNGATIINRKREFISECNRFPVGYVGNVDDRDEKLAHIGHAEADAVFAAARFGIATSGATMYCPWAACLGCAKAIIFSGIAELVVHRQRMLTTPECWKPEVDKALKYLDDCNIKLRIHDGPIGGPKIIVNGELWQP